MKNLFVRIGVSLILGLPAYAIFALIRNFPFEQITVYAFIHYGLTASIGFYLIFEIQHQKSKRLNGLVTWNDRPIGRLLIELTSSLIITSGIVFICYYILYHFVWEMELFFPSLIFYVVLVYFISLCFGAYVNALPLMEEWKSSLLKNERLEKENVNARLEALQTQMSPHFLFNNLSILNGLIDQDTVRAKKYTTTMAEVFRYILSHRNHQIVSLNEELDFIRDYLFLLQTRFENKLIVDFKIEEGEYFIPPVTLQQLIENAIKHNEVSNQHPLKISIIQEGQYLIISNPIRERKTAVASTGLGLEAISQRYQLLTSIPVLITPDHHIFTVKIPLLEHD